MFQYIRYALDTRTGLAYDRAQNPAHQASLNAYVGRIALQSRTEIDIDDGCAAV
jgi:hypothetical protein